MASRRSTPRSSSSRRDPRRRASPPKDAVVSAQPAEASDFIRDLGIDSELQAVADGEQFLLVGDFEKARLAFARAWPVVRSPNVLFKLASAEEQSGHLAGAFEHYREFLSLTAAGTDYMRALATYESHEPRAIEEMRGQAERSLSALRLRLGD